MRILSVLLIFSITVGCNDAATAVEAPASNFVLATADNRFTPPNAAVRVGGTITWSFGSVPHTVIFETAAGRPENIQEQVENSTEIRTFNSPGLFRYTCRLHPTMAGEIDVRPAPSE